MAQARSMRATTRLPQGWSLISLNHRVVALPAEVDKQRLARDGEDAEVVNGAVNYARHHADSPGSCRCVGLLPRIRAASSGCSLSTSSR